MEQDPNWGLALGMGVRPGGSRAWKAEADVPSLGYGAIKEGEEDCDPRNVATQPAEAKQNKVQGPTYLLVQMRPLTHSPPRSR